VGKVFSRSTGTGNFENDTDDVGVSITLSGRAFGDATPRRLAGVATALGPRLVWAIVNGKSFPDDSPDALE
jgi:hypothetical protein